MKRWNINSKYAKIIVYSIQVTDKQLMNRGEILGKHGSTYIIKAKILKLNVLTIYFILL